MHGEGQPAALGTGPGPHPVLGETPSRPQARYCTGGRCSRRDRAGPGPPLPRASFVPVDASQHLHLEPASASGYWCFFFGGVGWVGVTEENVLQVPAVCPARSRCFGRVGPRLPSPAVLTIPLRGGRGQSQFLDSGVGENLVINLQSEPGPAACSLVPLCHFQGLCRQA